MLGHWTKRLIDQASDVPSIIFFFIISCKILCKNCFNLFSYVFYNFTKMNIKSFECPKAIRNYEKNNAWNIKRLVGDSFVQMNQQSSILYYRLTNL